MGYTLDNVRTWDNDGCTLAELDVAPARGTTTYVTDADGFVSATVTVEFHNNVLTVHVYDHTLDILPLVAYTDHNGTLTDLLV